MKNFYRNYAIATGAVLSAFLVFGFTGQYIVQAATTPSLGGAGTYGLLSSTFTRNGGNTAIVGDLGYTTLGGVGTHTATGTTTVANATYDQAGIDQGTALTALSAPAQPCTFTFADGAINLATDTTHGAIGVYTPGVYCTGAASAASIGAGGITLSGAGTYIFRINGALTTVANSVVTLANGASSCDVFWTPTAATTLGANSTFVGTDIDASGITIGSTVGWTGRALAFGGTVIADTDTITSSCVTAAVSNPQAASGSSPQRDGTINVIKTIINDNGRTKTVQDFNLFVNGVQVISGVTNNFAAPAPAYTVTESIDANYNRVFSGDCDSDGRVSVSPGNNKFCIITNNDIGAPVIVPPVPPLIDVIKVPNPLALPNGSGTVLYTYTLRNIGTVPVADVTMIGDTCSPIVLISGDTNIDGKLDVNETWVHTCSTTLAETHTNTVVATGWANGLSAIDIASATVVVGVPVVPPLIHVTKIPSPLTLSAGGGLVTYTKKVTNPGAVALENVRLTDDKCDPVNFVYGDTNVDSKLDVSETWTYTCQSNLTETTTNTVVAEGDANGLTARDFAVATVVVATAIPILPNTGYDPFSSLIFFGIFVLMSALLFVFLRKRTT